MKNHSLQPVTIKLRMSSPQQLQQQNPSFLHEEYKSNDILYQQPQGTLNPFQNVYFTLKFPDYTCIIFL